MSRTQAEIDAEVESCLELIWASRMELMLEDEVAEEEAQEKLRRSSGGRMKKRKTAAGESSKKEAEEEESDNEEGTVEVISTAKSELSRIRKIIEAKSAEFDAEKKSREDHNKTKTMTEEDVAAAAVYRAKAEEAHMNHDRDGELDFVIKWIATGDPEALTLSDQWMHENMEAMKLEPKDPTDWSADQAKEYRKFWDVLWAGSFGKWDDITLIQPMPYTDEEPLPGTVFPIRTLQVFSVKVAAIKEGLNWPIDVFGIVAARDSLDHNRNVIFDRTRDNCQTIDKENQCLTLTGPTRVVVVVDPVYFEVNLQGKGRTESEDRDLSYLAVECRESGCSESYKFKRVYTSKLSTVELTLGDMVESVEATISVKVVDGEWPEGFGGLISAKTASISDMNIELLAFDKLPIAADGTIHLSRCVVSVEADGMLRVSVMANCLEDQTVERDSKAFKAKEASRSTRILEVCSCKLEVTIAWSLVKNMPHFR